MITEVSEHKTGGKKKKRLEIFSHKIPENMEGGWGKPWFFKQ